MDNLLDIKRICFLGFLIHIGFGLVELVWAKNRGFKIHEGKESFINIMIMVVNLGLNTLIGGGTLFLFQKMYNYSFFKIPSNVFTLIILFLGIDFVVYWLHRLIHQTQSLFFIHAIHHSSRNLNITHVGRVSWLDTITSLLSLLPFSLIGFEPTFVLSVIVLHQVGVGWNHTQMIKKMGFLEKIIVTPSHHRVHHGCNSIYVNKNFGRVFIFWDKLFNTFEAETEKVVYGVSGKLARFNPYYIQYQLLLEQIKKR